VGDIVILTLYIYAFAIAISTLVAVMIKGITVVCSLTQEPRKPERSPQEQPVGASDQRDEHVPIAAISAAVYALVGPHRIVHIEHAARSPAWVAAGRVRHHSAHNLPRHRH